MFNTIKEFYKRNTKNSHWDGGNLLDLKINKFSRYYYLGDILHRKDGPAYIEYEYNYSGDNYPITKEIYYNNGKIHRENGPAIIEYNGHFRYCLQKYVDYYAEGKLKHIKNKNLIYFFRNRVATKEIYFNDGIIHREDGPALLEYDNIGDFISKEYYFFGHKSLPKNSIRYIREKQKQNA